MAKKKSRDRRTAPRMSAKKKCCWFWGMFWVKLCAMAFILFVITAWPAAMNLVQSIHWGWFLGATIVFWLLAMVRYKRGM